MLPGAGQALMLRQTLRGGPAMARPTIMGTATGLLIWSTAAAAGLSGVLLANPHIYQGIRVIGGVVLVVLGVGTLRAARRFVEAPSAVSDDDSDGRFWGAYAAGLGTNLGNPKAGVFAVSMLPQFVTSHGPVLASGIALGVVWAAVTACWYLVFTLLVARGRARVSRPGVQRGLSVTTGIVLMALGVAVAAGV
ncbi:LysE family translocator [Catenulispora rubra]|uniref:LysE family translocator n=1 Tax=Catenulispora rubra TaxID=280293 RepID=UPI001E3C02F6|nr:LysE family translocator [Catenulispora rubra]